MALAGIMYTGRPENPVWQSTPIGWLDHGSLLAIGIVLVLVLVYLAVGRLLRRFRLRAREDR